MGRYAIIKNGVVGNIAKANPEFAASQGWVEAPAHVGPGWGYDGASWTEPQPDPITPEMVNAERDRRIYQTHFLWDGKEFQSDADSLANVAGAATSAVAYMLAGGSPTEVFWADPSVPFTWLAADNAAVTMTPQQVVDFGNAAMAHKKNHIYAGRMLKDMDPIPQDFASDNYWP